MKNLMLCILLASLLAGCSKENIWIDGFNSSSWKNDPKGCKGDRKKYYTVLIESKGKLLGAEEPLLTKLLGDPDQIELSRRNEKIYYYFYSVGSQCSSGEKPGKKIEIRLNSIHQVKEVNLKLH